MAGLDVQEWGTRELEGCSDSSLEAHMLERGEDSTQTKFPSQHSVFAWAVALFGAEFSHLLWHMLASQLLQEKVKDHLSPAQSALRKVHCATKLNAHRYFFQCRCGSYSPRVEKLMPCCATGFG